MTSAEQNTYHEKDGQMSEVTGDVLPFILTGEESRAKTFHDLKGLRVFAVIGALREHDEKFHGDDTQLDEEQRARLAWVESTVDKAVEDNMHYFPFGHNEDRFAIDYSETGDTDDRQRAKTREVPPAVAATSGTKSVRARRRQEIRRSTGEAGDTSPLPSPVTIKSPLDYRFPTKE